MIEAFQNINKAFESKVRLGIMAVLMVNEEADFNFLKEQLSLTDGNLASHTRALEELGYIECSKGFVGRKPQLFSGPQSKAEKPSNLILKPWRIF